MAFITVNKQSDNSEVTINTAHIVYLEASVHGGTRILLTPATGPGASLTFTARQNYKTLAEILGA